MEIVNFFLRKNFTLHVCRDVPIISGGEKDDHVSLAVNAFALSLSKLKLKKQTNGRYGDEILALSTVPHLCPYLYKQLVSRRFWRDTRVTSLFPFLSFFFFFSGLIVWPAHIGSSNRTDTKNSKSLYSFYIIITIMEYCYQISPRRSKFDD